MAENKKNVKYYLRETGGVVMLVNDVTVYSLDREGNWFPNQDLISMFIDGMVSYEEISESEVEEIISQRQSGRGSR